MLQRIEHVNHHSKHFGLEVDLYQKRYGSALVNYCVNKDASKWLKEDSDIDKENFLCIAIFRTKKLKQNA